MTPPPRDTYPPRDTLGGSAHWRQGITVLGLAKAPPDGPIWACQGRSRVIITWGIQSLP